MCDSVPSGRVQPEPISVTALAICDTLQDERFDLFGLALNRESPKWTDRGEVANERVRRCRDHDLARDRTCLEPCRKIDGVAVVTAANVMDYYSKYEFDPEIPIDFPPIDSVIWVQGIGILHAPLSAGKHTMTLDVKNTMPAFGSFFEYHNTWNIRVVKAK